MIPEAVNAMESRRISDIKVPICFRYDMGDIAGLAESIRTLGLFPGSITITRDNNLFRGRRCLKACELLGWDRVPVTIWEGPPHGSSDGSHDSSRNGR
jgi:ParB-like chromosome segregation protein Spo0J